MSGSAGLGIVRRALRRNWVPDLTKSAVSAKRLRRVARPVAWILMAPNSMPPMSSVHSHDAERRNRAQVFQIFASSACIDRLLKRLVA
jgi:hypothetical protein